MAAYNGVGDDSSNRLSRRVRQELTCTYCRNLFDVPKVLPCLHSFCKGCLERIQGFSQLFTIASQNKDLYLYIPHL